MNGFSLRSGSSALASDWRERPLGDLVDVAVGGLWGEEDPADETWVPVRVIRGVDAWRLSERERPDLPVRWVARKTLAGRELGPGDIVLEASGACGRSVVIEQSLVNDTDLPLSFSNFCRRLIPRPNVDPTFLGYRLRLAYSNGELSAFVTGTAMPNLDVPSLLTDFTVALPSLEEQRAAVELLVALDEKVEWCRRRKNSLENLLRTVFKSWFLDYDPVKRPEGIPLIGPPGILTSRFPADTENSEHGVLPVGWRFQPLGELLVELETGSRPKGGVAGYSVGVPSLGAESVIGLGAYDYAKTKYVPREFFDGMTRGHVKNRDILIYKDGGRPGEFEPHVAMLGDGFPFPEYAINEHVYRAQTSLPHGQNYLFLWLSSSRSLDEMRSKGTGVAIPGLNGTAVRSLIVLVPPDDILAAFDSLAEPVVARVLALSRETRAARQLRDTVLPTAILPAIDQ